MKYLILLFYIVALLHGFVYRDFEDAFLFFVIALMFRIVKNAFEWNNKNE